MGGKVSNNFSEYISLIWKDYFEIECKEIVDLLSHEFYGLLKQISMIAKSYNCTIEFSNISNGFSKVISNTPNSIITLITNQYNFCYQELYSKIIKDGDYALKPNRYEASNERIKLLEKAYENYRLNLADVAIKMEDTFSKRCSEFVSGSVVNDLLSCLEDEFFELPCKQNKTAYNECVKLLNKTKDNIIPNINEICLKYTSRLNANVGQYINEKIYLEKGNTYSSYDWSQIKESLKRTV